MKVKLTEQQFRRVIMNQQPNIGAILMTGLRSGKTHEEQKKYFIDGFGSDNIEAFPYHKTEISEFLETVKENPNASVVLYSAAARHADIVASAMADKSKLIIVEPYYSKGGTAARAVQSAVISGVPSTNVQVDKTNSNRGLGILDDIAADLKDKKLNHTPTLTPEHMGHYKALTYAASQL